MEELIRQWSSSSFAVCWTTRDEENLNNILILQSHELDFMKQMNYKIIRSLIFALHIISDGSTIYQSVYLSVRMGSNRYMYPPYPQHMMLMGPYSPLLILPNPCHHPHLRPHPYLNPPSPSPSHPHPHPHTLIRSSSVWRVYKI